jgi:Protein of unknown function (DUF3775)
MRESRSRLRRASPKIGAKLERAMPTLPIERILHILDLAWDVTADEPPELDHDAETIDEDAEILLRLYAGQPGYHDLAEAVTALDPGGLAELLALGLIGRGDFAPEEWPEALAAARALPSGDFSELVIETLLLTDYIEEALDALGYPIVAMAEALDEPDA